MHSIFLVSLLFHLNSYFALFPKVETSGGFRFSNYKTKYVTMPQGLEQAIKELDVYKYNTLALGMKDFSDVKLVGNDSLLTNAANTGIFNTFCDPYEPAVDLNPSGLYFDRARVSLVGRLPYSTNFTTTVVLVEYDVRAYCDYKFVMLLLNTKGSRILSVARVAIMDFEESRAGITELTQNRTFYYEDEPYYEDLVISREGLKVLKAEGNKTPEKEDDWAEYIINYATFKIDKDGYINVVEKGWIYY